MELSTDPKSISNYLMLLKEDSNVEPFNQISNNPLDLTYNTEPKNLLNKLKKIKPTLFRKMFLYYLLNKNQLLNQKEKLKPTNTTLIQTPKETVWLEFYTTYLNSMLKNLLMILFLKKNPKYLVLKLKESEKRNINYKNITLNPAIKDPLSSIELFQDLQKDSSLFYANKPLVDGLSGFLLDKSLSAP